MTNIIETIKNNPQNALFFKASKAHGDKGYKIIHANGHKTPLLQVTTEHGNAYYKLNGTKIGNWTPLNEINLTNYENNNNKPL